MQNPQATQKGDVYSFGILLYEIYGRKGPFGIGHSDALTTTFKEIIEKLRNPINPMVVVRPPLHIIEAPECVKQSIVLCWNEDPEARPDMRLVRIKLKELQGGLWVEFILLRNYLRICTLITVISEIINQGNQICSTTWWLWWRSTRTISKVWCRSERLSWARRRKKLKICCFACCQGDVDTDMIYFRDWQALY